MLPPVPVMMHTFPESLGNIACTPTFLVTFGTPVR
jgi:hypothetical protein